MARSTSLSRRSSAPVQGRSNPSRRGLAGLPGDVSRFVAAVLGIVLASVVAVPGVSAGGAGELGSERIRYDILRELYRESETYRVDVAAVVAPNVSKERRSVLGGYLRIVRDIVGDIPVRYLEDAEREDLAVRRIAEYRREIEDEIDSRIREIHRFRIETREDRRNPRPTVDENEGIRALRRELDVLESIESGDLAVPEVAEIEIPAEEEFLYRWTLWDPEGIARQREADLLLYAEVEPIEELFVFTVHLYHPLNDTDREVLRVVATAEDVPVDIERYRREIVSAVAGRPLGEVTVTAVGEGGAPEEEAKIYLGDELIGVGSGRDGYVPAGAYRVRGTTPDGRSRTRLIEVVEEESTTVTLRFDELRAQPVTIRSVPPGASVYRGVLWQGYTPLTVPRPPESLSYTVSLDEYYSSRFEVGPETPDEIETVLVPIEYDREEATKLSRDRFYRSFGAFALSVGVPIILYGTYQDYGGLYPGGVARSDLSVEEQERMQGEADTLFYGYYGSLALSAGLFTHMIWRLVDYIQTAQEYHEQ